MGLGKGTEGIYIDAVWESNDIHMNELPPREFRITKQIYYIIIQLQPDGICKNVAIKPTATQLKMKKDSYKNCLQLDC